MSDGSRNNNYIAGISPDLLLKAAGFPECSEKDGGKETEARLRDRRKLQKEVLKRIEFEESVTDKTLSRLETGYKNILGKMMRRGARPDLEELESAVAALTDETESGSPFCMAGLKSHASYLHSHSIRCGIIASHVASGMNYGEDEIRDFVVAMILHDIGMLAVPEEILKKRKHTSEDNAEIERHSEYGFELLKKTSGASLLCVVVAYGHHLLANGAGYPAGADFGVLPPIARLAPIIDNFEALSAERPQRNALTPAEAIRELTENRERYDPAALEGFLRAAGVYPVNTYLRLNTGEIGVVIRNNDENPALPVIKLLIDPLGKPYAREILVDTLNDSGRKIEGEV